MKSFFQYIEAIGNVEIYERILARISPGQSKLVGGRLVERGIDRGDARFADLSSSYRIDGGDWMSVRATAEKLVQ